MPSARVVVGCQPSWWMRLTSSSFCGVPSGFVVSKTRFPLKLSTAQTCSASSRMVTSLPVPMLISGTSSSREEYDVFWQVHEKDTGFGQVFTEEEFAARCACSPNDNLVVAQGFCFRHLSDQCRQDVRVLRIEVVSRTIEVGGHGRQISGVELAVVGPTHLDAGDFG